MTKKPPKKERLFKVAKGCSIQARGRTFSEGEQINANCFKNGGKDLAAHIKSGVVVEDKPEEVVEPEKDDK